MPFLRLTVKTTFTLMYNIYFLPRLYKNPHDMIYTHWIHVALCSVWAVPAGLPQGATGAGSSESSVWSPCHLHLVSMETQLLSYNTTLADMPINMQIKVSIVFSMLQADLSMHRWDCKMYVPYFYAQAEIQLKFTFVLNVSLWIKWIWNWIHTF